MRRFREYSDSAVFGSDWLKTLVPFSDIQCGTEASRPTDAKNTFGLWLARLIFIQSMAKGNTPNLSTPVSRIQHRMKQVPLRFDWLVCFYPIAGKGGPIAACQRVSSCPFRRLPLVVIGSSDCLCLIGQNNCLLHPKKNQHTLIMIIKFYSWISINDFTPNILGKQL